MNKVIRTALSLVVSLALFSAVAMARPQAGGNNSDNDKKKHSRVGKVAFWRHKKDDNTKAKGPTPSAKSAAKTPEAKPAKTGAKASQAKPASPKQNVTGKGQKQGQQSPHQVASTGKAPAPARHPAARKPQLKPASAKQPVDKKKDQKSEQQPAEHQ